MSHKKTPTKHFDAQTYEQTMERLRQQLGLPQIKESNPLDQTLSLPPSEAHVSTIKPSEEIKNLQAQDSKEQDSDQTSYSNVSKQNTEPAPENKSSSIDADQLRDKLGIQQPRQNLQDMHDQLHDRANDNADEMAQQYEKEQREAQIHGHLEQLQHPIRSPVQELAKGAKIAREHLHHAEIDLLKKYYNSLGRLFRSSTLVDVEKSKWAGVLKKLYEDIQKRESNISKQ